jgi:hypothetical protein
MRDKIAKYKEVREALMNLQHESQTYNHSFLNLYKHLKGIMVGLTAKQNDMEPLVYVKSIIVKNFRDYTLFRIKQKQPIETINKSS